MVLKIKPRAHCFYACLLPRCIHCRLVQVSVFTLHITWSVYYIEHVCYVKISRLFCQNSKFRLSFKLLGTQLDPMDEDDRDSLDAFIRWSQENANQDNANQDNANHDDANQNNANQNDANQDNCDSSTESTRYQFKTRK